MLYFLLFVAMGLSAPFYGLILEKLVPDKGKIGLIFGLLFLVTLSSSLLWGVIVDVTKRRRLILSLCMVVGLSARAVGLLLIPPSSHWIAPFSVMLGTEIIVGAMYPLMDAHVMSLLGASGPQIFGRQRLWGAIGWGLSATVSGAFFSRGILGVEWGLVATPIMCCVVGAVLMAPHSWPCFRNDVEEGRQLQLENNGASNNAQKKKGGSFLEGLRNTHLRWQQVAFLAFCSFAGMSSTSIGTFLFLHLETLGGSELLDGLTIATMIVSEVPFMFFAGSFASKYGVFTVILVAFSCYFARFAGYALLTPGNAWFVLLIEPLHGITFGVFYASTVAYVQSLAKEGTANTMQGVFQASMSLGRMTGSIVGGQLFAVGGGRLMFTCGAVMMFCITIVWSFVVCTDRGFVDNSGPTATEQVKAKEVEESTVETELIDDFASESTDLVEEI